MARTNAKGTTITYALVPCSAFLEIEGKEINTFVATMSNVVDTAHIVVVPADTLSSSSIHLVTQEFAKTLPKSIPKGTAFTDTSAKAKTIKSFLPTPGQKYHLVILPNALPIRPGEEAIVKGIPNDVMCDTFRSMGDVGYSWLQIMTDSDEGAIAFNIDLQTTALANKTELDKHFPGGELSKSLLFQKPWATLHNPPVEDDEEGPLAMAITELRSQLLACKERNAPAQTVSPNSRLPRSVGGDGDIDSVLDLTPPSAPAASSNTKRIESMLQLLCAGYDPTDGLKLLDLKQQATSTASINGKAMTSAMANMLRTTSDKQADSLDCINRYAHFPVAYRWVPAILYFMVRGTYATDPITDLEAVASGKVSSFTTGHYLPHGKDIDELLGRLKKDSILRSVQEAMNEDPTKMKKQYTEGVCTATIKDQQSLVSMTANVTVFMLVLTAFDAESTEPGKVPFMHLAARKIGLALSSKEYRNFLDRTPCHSKLHYYVFNLADRVFTTYLKVLEDEDSIAAATYSRDGYQGTLNSTHARMANTTLEEGLKTIAKVCAEAEPITGTPIHDAYSKSAFCTPPPVRKRQIGTDYSDDDAKRKKAKADKDAKRKQGVDKPVNIGAIQMVGKKAMPMPKDGDWPEGEKPLCGGKLRDGSRGCGRPQTCTFNHSPPSSWSASLLEFMKKHVAKNDCLKWNYNVVTPEMLGLQYARSEEVNTNP